MREGQCGSSPDVVDAVSAIYGTNRKTSSNSGAGPNRRRARYADLKEFCHQVYVVVFLIQKAPLPEHMIGADAAFFPEEHFKLQSDTINQGMEGEGGPVALAVFKIKSGVGRRQRFCAGAPIREEF